MYTIHLLTELNSTNITEKWIRYDTDKRHNQTIINLQTRQPDERILSILPLKKQQIGLAGY